jgi:tetratricopeptide (TPR) repeat protein
MPSSLRARLTVATVFVALLIGASYAYRALTTPPPATSTVAQVALYGDAVASSAVTDAMVSTLQDWLRQHPADEPSYALLGAAYLQKARETADPAYYTKAEAVLQKAVSLPPADFNAISSLGVLALARHQFREGLEYGRQAHLLNSYNARALGVVVDGQVELGDYDAAVQSAQSMVDLRPDMGSYARVSYVRELYGDWQGALAMMRQAVEAGSGVAENLAWTRTQAGLLLFNHGDLDGAERELEAAQYSVPGYIPAQAAQARVLVARGDLTAAIARYENISRVMPLTEYVIALGDCYTLAGRGVDAQRAYSLVGVIAQLQRANGVDTDLEMSLFEADHAASEKDFSQTVERARHVFQLRPTVYAADVLAWSLYQAGQFNEAQSYSQLALRLNTQDALLWFHAGMIEKRLGQRAAAAQKLSHALEINPHFSLLWTAVARQALVELRQ